MDPAPKGRTVVKKTDSNSAGKGDHLVNQAHAKLQEPKGFFENFMCTITGPEGRKEGALEKLQDAIIHFKLAKEWIKAGQAYLKIVSLLPELNASQIKIAMNYAAASHCFLKEPAGESEGLKALAMATKIYSEEGDWAQATNTQKQIAEYLEAHNATNDQIAEAWLKVADLNEMDSSYALRNSCLNKVATIYGIQKKYLEAAEIYDIIGANMVKDEMLKYGAREPWKNEGLCRLALGDLVHLKKLNDKCLEKLPEYAETREYKLISVLAQRIEEQDVSKFEEEVAKYHKFTPFEQWQLDLLNTLSSNLDVSDTFV